MRNKVYVIAKVENVPDEEFREYASPMKTRRFSHMLKRALATALKCMRSSGIEQPDAIINATVMGSWEESENILQALHDEGERVSMPAQFSLCTHNTVATQIAIFTQNHGYNNTYSQGKVSLETALLDAFIQIGMGKIHNALVCANDEPTEGLLRLMEKVGIDTSYCPNRSVAYMLADTPGKHPLGEIQDIRIIHVRNGGDKAIVSYKKLCD